MRSVAQRKSCAVHCRLASGSSRCASKPGRDHHQLGARARAPPAAPGPRRPRASRRPPRHRRQRDVDDVADARLARVPGAGIERHLVRRGEQHAGVLVEDVLRAVAVVHVEVDDRHPVEPQRVQRVQRADGDVREQAEPHRPLALGMVAAGAHGAEGGADLARHHRLDGGDVGAGGMAGGGDAVGAHMRVGVEADPALLRHVLQDQVEIALRVRAQQLLVRRRRRLDALQRVIGTAQQQPVDRLDARHALGMPGRGDVQMRGGVVVDSQHRADPSASAGRR